MAVAELAAAAAAFAAVVVAGVTSGRAISQP
jgi:hypothetical protein